MKPTRALAAVVLVAALLSGCGDDAGGGADPDAAEPTGTVDHSSAESILAAYGLDGMEPAALVDHLDRLPPDDRPEGLQVSVRPARLLVSAGEEEHPLPLPKDSFYVSVAPWVEQTHDCTWHALTSCLGEMQAEDVHVKVVEKGTRAVLIDEELTTFDNGFLGFWLPRGIEGTITMEQGDLQGRTRFATGDRSPTCLTTLRLKEPGPKQRGPKERRGGAKG